MLFMIFHLSLCEITNSCDRKILYRMAEGETENIGEEVCSFDFYSSCQNGGRNKHVNNSTCSSERGDVCSFFLKGNCKFGDECWFLHPAANEDMNLIYKSLSDIHITELNHQKIENCNPLTTNRDVPIRNELESFNSIRNTEPISCGPGTSNWVNAPEFVPKKNISYSDALKSNNGVFELEPQKYDMEYCEHYYEGVCPNYDCPCIHGNLCEICGTWCLDPSNERQRDRHIQECEKEFEQNMEFSFALQRSLDKTCGICMEVIMEKKPISEQYFGILENCNHVYCLSCIRKWRSVETYEIAEEVEREVDPVVTRSCPECRVSSHFITPSQYYVDSESDKKKLISEYKLALSKRPCRYFKQGEGKCPFGGACFYLHAKPDGTKVVLPLPTSKRRRQNQDAELDYDYEDGFQLWDFLEVRESIG